MKTFKDIKSGDKLYFIQDYEKLNGQKPTSNIQEIFASMMVEPEVETEGVDICEVEVKDVEYPAIRRWPVHYMKMDGNRPNGVGASYAEEPDEEHITIKLESIYDSNIETSFDAPIDNTSYSPIKGGTYITNKKESIKYFKELIDSYIKKYTEESIKYKQKAVSLKEYKKHIVTTF